MSELQYIKFPKIFQYNTIISVREYEDVDFHYRIQFNICESGLAKYKVPDLISNTVQE